MPFDLQNCIHLNYFVDIQFLSFFHFNSESIVFNGFWIYRISNIAGNNHTQNAEAFFVTKATAFEFYFGWFFLKKTLLDLCSVFIRLRWDFVVFFYGFISKSPKNCLGSIFENMFICNKKWMRNFNSNVMVFAIVLDIFGCEFVHFAQKSRVLIPFS